MLRRFLTPRLFLIFPLAYAVILAVLYFYQDSMIFLAKKDSEESLIRKAAEKKFEPWRNAKGELIGWQSRKGDPQNALLICCGNAGYALGRTYHRRFLHNQNYKWKIFILEYPGYGSRAGPPSEETLINASLEAFDTLVVEPERTVWVLGESLGSGVASALAAARPDKVAGLILVTPYDSFTNTARSHFPWLPVATLVRTRFDSASILNSYPGPVAFILGEGDRTVPTALGEKLYEGYQGRKHRWLVPKAGHNCSDFLRTDWPQIAEFLQADH